MSFADLTAENVALLNKDGYITKEIKDVSVHPTVTPPTPVPPGITIYTPTQLFDIVGAANLQNLTTPPLYGHNMNIALIDTGVRATHIKLVGHIAFEQNFTDDPDATDGYDHGTGTASIIAALAPQANILNMKVLDNSGYGDESHVATAIDYCIDMQTTNPNLAPSVINISLGTEDDGDPNAPLRVMCRHAIASGIIICAAAGNGGPETTTIMSPACEPEVIAVGSCGIETHVVSGFSSRGPTVQGAIKPDCVLFGEGVVVASSASDSAMAAKSGTSFSAPIASSLALLAQEGIVRMVSYQGGVPLGLQTQSVSQSLTNADLLNTWLPQITVKPSGVSTLKDNDYGYGLPFGPLINDAVNSVLPTQSVGIDMNSLVSMMLVLMVMKMMMGTMSGMGNNTRRIKQA
jgi:serine protease AprX